MNLSQLTKILDARSHDEADAVDVVAIHGINGHATHTWKAKEGLLWLNHFIHHTITRKHIEIPYQPRATQLAAVTLPRLALLIVSYWRFQ